MTLQAVDKTLPFQPVGVAGDPEGTLVAFRAGAGTMAYSVDGGDSWTEQANPLTSGCHAVHWNGTYFLAVYNNTAAKSADGISWTTDTFPSNPTRSWEPALAWSPDLSLWLCTYGAQSSGASTVATSPDGETWTENAITGGTGKTTLDCAWDDAGERFLVLLEDVSDSSTRKLYESAIGTGSWSLVGEIDIGEADPDYLAVNSAGKLLAYGNSAPAASDDGATWTYPGHDRSFAVLVLGTQFLYDDFQFTDRWLVGTDGAALAEQAITDFDTGLHGGSSSRSYGGDGSTYAFHINSTTLTIVSEAPPDPSAFWTDFVGAAEDDIATNELVKDTIVTSSGGTPGNPGTPGTPAREAYHSWETVQVCGFFSSGITYAWVTPQGVDGGEPQYIPIATSANGVGTTTYSCRSTRKLVYHPAEPAVPGTPSSDATRPRTTYEYNLGWNSGARSIGFIEADGFGQFSIPAGVVGAVAGLAELNDNQGYGDIAYGIQAGSGLARIVEDGQVVFSIGAYDGDTVFRIVRQAGVVSYYVDGDLVYTSEAANEETLYLDASLYSGGDSITSPSIGGLAGAEIVLPPLHALGGIPIAQARLTLPALEAVAYGGPTITLPALAVLGGQGAFGQATVTLPIFTLEASGGYGMPDFAIGLPVLGALQVAAHGLTGEIGGANLTLPGLRALAANRTYGEARITLPPLQVFADASEGMLEASLHAGVSAAPRLDPSHVMLAVLSGGFTVDDTLAGARLLVAQLDASVTADDAMTARAVFSALLEAGIAIAGVPTGDTADTSDFDVWVLDVDSGASVPYEAYEFNSFARIGQRYFGCKADGIYLLEGASDAGEPIRASINFGATDFGIREQKRIPHVYVGIKSDGQLALRVQADDGTAYTYGPRAYDSARKAQRFDLGRGLKGSYWTLELYNDDGADFDIDWIEVFAVPTTRRI